MSGFSPSISPSSWDLPIDVKRDYGASGSSQSTTGGIASGQKTLTLTAAKDFANGQGISVAGATGTGALLVSSIVSGGGTTTLTLADAAGTTVAGAAVNHDDTAAIKAALSALPAVGGIVDIPVGTYMLSDGLTNSLPCVTVRGRGWSNVAATAVTVLKWVSLGGGTDGITSLGNSGFRLDNLILNLNNLGRDAVSLNGDAPELSHLFITNTVRDGIHVAPQANDQWTERLSLHDIILQTIGKDGLRLDLPAVYTGTFINLTTCQRLNIRNCGQYECHITLESTAGSGTKVEQLTFIDCAMDGEGNATHGTHGFYIEQVNGGTSQVIDLTMIDSAIEDTGTARAGYGLEASATGIVEGVNLLGCDASNYSGLVSVLGSNFSNLLFKGNGSTNTNTDIVLNGKSGGGTPNLTFQDTDGEFLSMSYTAPSLTVKNGIGATQLVLVGNTEQTQPVWLNTNAQSGNTGVSGITKTTMTGNVQLTAGTSSQFQSFNVNGAARSITFAGGPFAGAWFRIEAYGLSATDTATINGTVYGSASVARVVLDVVWDGAAWQNVNVCQLPA